MCAEFWWEIQKEKEHWEKKVKWIIEKKDGVGLGGMD
jgi:hypothetical protein